MPTTTDQVLATAPGKLILMGEHAAVHGHPAVVATLGLSCRVVCSRGEAGPVRIQLDDDTLVEAGWPLLRRYAVMAAAGDTPDAAGLIRSGAISAAHLPLVTVGLFADACRGRALPPLTFQVSSAVPRSRGLGSSAALATAVMAAASTACGMPYKAPAFEQLVARVEQHQHHRASGVDHRTIIDGGVLAFRREGVAFRAEPMRVADTILSKLAIYDTGPTEPTGQVVEGVATWFSGRNSPLSGLLNQMAAHTETFTDAIRRDDGVRDAAEAIHGYQYCLERLGVVPPGVRRLARIIELAGGAAKVSGSGSRIGPGAGALMVLWPDGIPHVNPFSAELPQIAAAVGVPGMSVGPCP